MKITLTYIIT